MYEQLVIFIIYLYTNVQNEYLLITVLKHQKRPHVLKNNWK